MQFTLRALALAAGISLIALSTPAHSEQATVAEQEAGCPAALPTFKPQANANFTVLDRTGLTRECLAKLYEQNGDPNGADDEDDE